LALETEVRRNARKAFASRRNSASRRVEELIFVGVYLLSRSLSEKSETSEAKAKAERAESAEWAERKSDSRETDSREADSWEADSWEADSWEERRRGLDHGSECNHESD